MGRANLGGGEGQHKDSKLVALPASVPRGVSALLGEHLPENRLVLERNEVAGKITFCPSDGGTRGGYMRLAVQDTGSGQRIVDVSLTVEQVGRMMRGEGNVPCAVVLPDHPERIGKKLEFMDVVVVMPTDSYNVKKTDLAAKAHLEHPGWTFIIGGSERLHCTPCSMADSVAFGMYYNYRLTGKRWV